MFCLCVITIIKTRKQGATKMITGKLVDAAGKPRDPFITGYATMNEAYLALQEYWPVVTERNHNSMTLADQQGCRLILQERKA